jgi:Protein of unknown function (DUF998)
VKTNRALLAGGVAAGPVFVLSVGLQMVVRPGFDALRDPLSLLTLGDWGWVQVATFVLTGALGIAGALGVRRALAGTRGGTWGPAMLGLWGVGLIAAGAFVPDPALGFPPGTPPGVPGHMSWHSTLHGVAFFTAFSSLVAACIVFARRFAGLHERAWLAYSVATAVIAPIIIAVGMTITAAVPFAVAALLGFGWITAVTLHLSQQGRRPGRAAQHVLVAEPEHRVVPDLGVPRAEDPVVLARELEEPVGQLLGRPGEAADEVPPQAQRLAVRDAVVPVTVDDQHRGADGVHEVVR